MPVPLLPNLIDDHNVGVFNSVGQWDIRSVDELEKISRGLHVNSKVSTQINSIPDVWARVLLFEMALFNKEHPLHFQILGEWRGLLAMLALRGVKRLNAFKTKKIEITDDPKAPAFLQAASKLLPRKKTISTDTSWNQLYLFLYQVGNQTQSIGMTSPTTLVVTSTYYFNHINQNEVSWFDGKHLQDPVPKLSRQEKIVLASWLHRLEANLAGHGVLEEAIWNKIARLLQEFQNDLNVRAQDYAPGTTFGIQGAGAGVFIHLDKPGTYSGDDSNVKLIASRPGAPAMFLVDKDIAEQWGVTGQDVAVNGAATLADIPFNGMIERTQIGNHRITGGELWQPKELFTEKLYVIRQKDAFIGARSESWDGNPPQLNNQDISIILPINDELLKYLTEDDLLSKLLFSQGADGEITVTLTLSLSGLEPHNTYEARKTYSRQEIIDYDQIPILEIFPNFKNDAWKGYYIGYSADNPKATFQIKPLPFVKEAEVQVPGNVNAQRRIWRLDSYPLALGCYAGNEKAGLLLLNPARNLSSENRHFTVGVDFGASGTCVYESLNGDKKPLIFKNRNLTVTNISPAQASEVFDFFLPNRDIPTPFLSFFQTFNNDGGASVLEPILHGHTYYTDDDKLQLFSQKANIKTDLKWSEDEFERACARSFITQICLQTAAELAEQGGGNIDWEFSYPTAFADADAYKVTCQLIIQDVANLSGIRYENISFNTESVAAAQFFRTAQNAKTTLGAVFVDIGSSTSDISVWQKPNNDDVKEKREKLLWQISLRYAGRDIFLDYFYYNKSIRETFAFPSPTKGDGSPNDKKEFYAQVDAVLRKDNANVFARLPIAAGRQDVRDLKQHLALGLSGLFYYMGLGIKHLHQENIYQRLEIPHFYFGGNGSQIFRWLTNGTWQNDNIYSKLFESVFIKALAQHSEQNQEENQEENQEDNLGGFFRVEMSNLPKEEAAYGLVCGDILTVPDQHNNMVIAGENFKENGITYQWNAILNNNRMTDTLDLPANLEKLSEFIAAFNEFAANSNGQIQSLNVTQQKLSEIRGRLANDLSDLARQREREEPVVIQPIFVMALKHLLRVQ